MNTTEQNKNFSKNIAENKGTLCDQCHSCKFIKYIYFLKYNNNKYYIIINIFKKKYNDLSSLFWLVFPISVLSSPVNKTLKKM